jgi:ADP-dependent NAD(P)H-hydrate dehydratase / NAD(P)H-hydrate epimerase
MRGVLTREQAQKYDRFASEQANVPSLLLMENAGRGAAECLLSLRNGAPGLVVVVAGPGNNGGDGFVLGRRLRVLGYAVEVWLVGAPARLVGDAKLMWDAYVGLGGQYGCVENESALPALQARLGAASTVVDALFGTGLGRPIVGLYARVIELMKQSSAFVFALDVASGLDANRGRILGVAVRAHATVTFGSPKLGHYTNDGVECSGRLEVVDIGIPDELCLQTGHSAVRLTAADLAPNLLPRSPASHKGRAGRIAVIAGHAGTSGAALLAARGALRMGAGMVTHVGLPATIASIESRVLEAMTRVLEPAALEQSLTAALVGMGAIVLGPGLGLGEQECRIVTHVAEHATLPVVVDADALSILAHDITPLSRAKGPRILLPHRGELARLLELSNSEVEDDPFGALERAVQLTQAIVVLKGPYSFVGAPNQKTAIVGSPSGAMGTAGSGDVLSGVVAALAIDHTPVNAARLGVHLHGRAGILWAEARGVDRGLVAGDVADNLPLAVAELSRCQVRVTV